MSPRRSIAEARKTRSSILDHAVEVSSREGLEGLTIGRLAQDLEMSKSGVLGHFGSKEALQLATLKAALEVYRRELWDPVRDAKPGRARLSAICDAWISYLERGVFPGGCYITAVASEFDDRGGPVHDAIADALSRWYGVLEAEARTAIEAGELPADADAATIAFQLNALAVGANQALQLLGDRKASKRARRLMQAVLDEGG
jgi:AcrR family transcriptional regulator